MESATWSLLVEVVKTREVEFRGTAPKEPGEAGLHFAFFAPFRNAYAMIQQDVTVRWK